MGSASFPGDRRGPWGVYDTAADCWLGGTGRPYVYDHKEGARESCERPATYDPGARPTGIDAATYIPEITVHVAGFREDWPVKLFTGPIKD